jgi:hypothetical protein
MKIVLLLAALSMCGSGQNSHVLDDGAKTNFLFSHSKGAA